MAVTVAVAQQVFWPKHHWIVALEVLALLAAWALLRVNRRTLAGKYLNDRYLGEWLRRAQFEVLLPPASWSNSTTPTKNAGNECTAVPAVGQVDLYHGPETWFVDAFQQVIDRAARQIHCDSSTAVAAIPLPTLRDALLKAWIEPQADWHAQAQSQHRKARFGQRMTFGLFVATLLFAVIHLLFGHALHGTMGHFVTLLAIVLPAAAATLHSIRGFSTMNERPTARNTWPANFADWQTGWRRRKRRRTSPSRSRSRCPHGPRGRRMVDRRQPPPPRPPRVAEDDRGEIAPTRPAPLRHSTMASAIVVRAESICEKVDPFACRQRQIKAQHLSNCRTNVNCTGNCTTLSAKYQNPRGSRTQFESYRGSFFRLVGNASKRICTKDFGRTLA